MSRFIDRLGPEAVFDQDDSRFFSTGNPPILEITNVLGDHQIKNLLEYPSVICPWPVAWFEYRYRAGDSIGARIVGIKATAQEWRRIRSDEDTREIHDAWFNSGAMFKASFIGSMMLFNSAEGAAVSYCHYLADRDGRPIDKSLFVQFEIAFADQAEYDHQVGLVQFAVAQFFYAISLCHCRNIVQIDHAPPPKVQARRKREGKEPLVTYKVLQIDPKMVKAQRHTDQAQQQPGEPQRALHIARGHFATYTKERPLFGRYVGTVWRPMHTRGSTKLGEVKKDYSIKGGR